MDRANRRYPAEARDSSELSCPPSVFLERQLHVADPLLDGMRPDAMIGAEHWMWATNEAASPRRDSIERVLGKVCDDQHPMDRAAVLSNNVCQLYDLELTESIDLEGLGAT